MRYSDLAPYEVLYTNDMTGGELDFIKQYASLWDRIANSGYFVRTLSLLTPNPSPILGIFGMDSLVFQETRCPTATHSKALKTKSIYTLPRTVLFPQRMSRHLIQDRMRLSRSIPRWLKAIAPVEVAYHHAQKKLHNIPKRQARPSRNHRLDPLFLTRLNWHILNPLSYKFCAFVMAKTSSYWHHRTHILGINPIVQNGVFRRSGHDIKF